MLTWWRELAYLILACYVDHVSNVCDVPNGVVASVRMSKVHVLGVLGVAYARTSEERRPQLL